MADYSLSGAEFGFSGSGSIFGDTPDTPVTTAATSDGGGGYFSGAMQALTALGTGYVSKRMDIDIAGRVQNAGVMPTLRTTQNGVLVQQAGIPQAGGVSAVVGQASNGQTVLNLSALLPFMIVGGLVWIATRAGK